MVSKYDLHLHLCSSSSCSTSLSMSLSSPILSQDQSPLFRLPPELRLEIYRLCLSTHETITDPAGELSPTGQGKRYSPYRHVPVLGIALRRTCQRIRAEVPLAPLCENHFTFTRAGEISSFLETLARMALPVFGIPLASTPAPTLRAFTISLLATPLHPTSADGTPSHPTATEWLHYLSCPAPHLHHSRQWCRGVPTLAPSVPKLEHLTLDLAGLASNLPAEMAYLGLKREYCTALAHLLCGMARAGPHPLAPARSDPGAGEEALESGAVDASPMTSAESMATKGLLRIGAAPHQSLRSLRITGAGAHLWDLGGVARPSLLGEWAAVRLWTDRVGELVPWLQAAVADPSASAIACAGPAGQDRDVGHVTGTRASCDGRYELLVEATSPWTGVRWSEKRFCLVAATSREEARRADVGEVYEHAVAWEDVQRLNREKDREGHPVFALFV